jgi:hypothetical protein
MMQAIATGAEEGTINNPAYLACELRHDAPHTPDVNSGCVVGGSKQHFRGSVPQRDDFVCVRLDGDGKVAAQPQIGNLEQRMCGGVVYEQVLRLEVTMHDAKLVHVCQSLQQLVHHALDEHWVQWEVLTLAVAVHVLLEVRAEELKDQIEARLAVFLQMLNTQQPAVVGRWLDQVDVRTGG